MKRAHSDNFDIPSIISVKVPPLEHLQVNGIEFQKPQEVTYYSMDSNRQMHCRDKRSLSKYIGTDSVTDICKQFPDEAANLSCGFQDRYITRDESVPEHLDTLIESLLDLDKSLLLDDDKDTSIMDPEIITWRGIMTRLMILPYSKDEWVFNACRYHNQIYIEEPVDLKFQLRNAAENTDQSKLMCFWGYRFELLCSMDLDQDVITQLTQGVVNTNVQFCSVVKTRLAGRHRLIMAGEVDCIDKEGGQFVELKTSKLMTNSRDQHVFERHKLLKSFFQSYLLGVDKIVYGFRDKYGSLKEVKEFSTLKIPRLVRGKQYWDHNVCLAWCDILLTQLKSVMTVNDHTAVYQISFKAPFEHVRIEKVHDSSLAFLPQQLLSVSSQKNA